LAGSVLEHPEDETEWRDEYTPPFRKELRRGVWVPAFELKNYQKTAVGFLHRCQRDYSFALLADEMGVGKVAHLKEIC
jgi:hypothetical protein